MNHTDHPDTRTQKRRRNVATTIARHRFLVLPDHILEVVTLLTSPTIDLSRVSELLQSEPRLVSQIVHLANSARSQQDPGGMRISEAVVLLGAEFLHTLVLSFALMESSQRQLPANVMQPFWQHCLLAAMLSEHMAHKLEYAEAEQAYLGGLLHDISDLPLLIEAHRGTPGGFGPPADWLDIPAWDHECFGVDHCKVGQSRGIPWRLAPCIIDVIEHHHNPSEAQRNRKLVVIVAAADYFCRLWNDPVTAVQSELRSRRSDKIRALLMECFPSLEREGLTALIESLYAEYKQSQAWRWWHSAAPRTVSVIRSLNGAENWQRYSLQ